MPATLSGIFGLILFSTGTLLISLSGKIPPFQLCAMTCFSCALILSLYFKIKGQSIKKELNAPISSYITIIIGIGVYQAMTNISFKNAPAFEINMLNYLWPIFLVVFSKYLHRQRIKANELVGMVCGFAGMILIFMPQNGTFGLFGFYYILMLLGAIVWAGYSAIISRQDVSVALLIPCTLFSGIVHVIIHLSKEQTVVQMPFHEMAAVILLCCSCGSYALWDYGMRKGDQILLGSLSYCLPLLSSVYFIIFGFMPASIEVALAGVLIIAGCIIVNVHKMNFKKREDNATI